MDQLIMNLIGTAYNVLMEQEHPDASEIALKMPEWSKQWGDPASSGAFDLRFRNIQGERI